MLTAAPAAAVASFRTSLSTEIVAYLEQELVPNLLAAVGLSDDRTVLALQSLRDERALQHPDRVVVERRVQHGGATLYLTVAVDRLDALRGCRLLDRRRRAGV